MNRDRQDLRPSRAVATSLPPATVDETGWDILLAMHVAGSLTLPKLASIVSVRATIVTQWLAKLEERQLVTGATDAGELRAVLTRAGRELLDKYLSATSDLQVVAHH
jgi:DNA-binding MarR family transcriptional regulator